MPLILIFLSVIMLLISVKSEKNITDLSDKCSRGEKIFLPLTTGVGRSDTSVTMIASHALFNCTLVYSVNSEDYVMAVVQFPDWRPDEKHCTHDHNSVIMVSETFLEENVCASFNFKSEPVFHKLGKGMLLVHINNLKGMRTMKFTATSMKGPQSKECNSKKEVECHYNSSVYCMHEITKCDGVINCGVKDEYDENKNHCEEAQLTFKVVVYTVVTGVVLLALFISAVVNVMPKNRTFIYKIYEETSLFDPSEDLINIDINIDVLFPSKLEEAPAKSSFSLRTVQDYSKKSTRVFK